MQMEGTKRIFVMNFSVLHFFKFASRMPQIAQILVSTFTIFGGGGGGGGGGVPWTLDPPTKFLFFFFFFFFHEQFQALDCNVPLPWG